MLAEGLKKSGAVGMFEKLRLKSSIDELIGRLQGLPRRQQAVHAGRAAGAVRPADDAHRPRSCRTRTCRCTASCAMPGIRSGPRCRTAAASWRSSREARSAGADAMPWLLAGCQTPPAPPPPSHAEIVRSELTQLLASDHPSAERCGCTAAATGSTTASNAPPARSTGCASAPTAACWSRPTPAIEVRPVQRAGMSAWLRATAGTMRWRISSSAWPRAALAGDVSALAAMTSSSAGSTQMNWPP